APAEAGTLKSAPSVTRDMSAPVILLLNARQRLELMERRRRGQRPFECRCAGAPRIARCDALLHESLDETNKEEEHANSGDKGSDRGHLVPAVERVRIIGYAARPAATAEEAHREEDDVDADEPHPEVQLRDGF